MLGEVLGDDDRLEEIGVDGDGELEEEELIDVENDELGDDDRDVDGLLESELDGDGPI